MRASATSPRRRRLPESEGALHELALSYLERFPTTAQRLERYLNKKLREAVRDDRCSSSDGQQWVRAVVARLTRAGILDDERWAASRVRVLHRRGRSARFIAQDLRQRGVAEATAARALDQLGDDSDLTAAIARARKRRLGPFDASGRRGERRQKHMAALARVGFSYDIARRVIDAPTVADLPAERT